MKKVTDDYSIHSHVESSCTSACSGHMSLSRGGSKAVPRRKQLRALEREKRVLERREKVNSRRIDMILSRRRVRRLASKRIWLGASLLRSMIDDRQRSEAYDEEWVAMSGDVTPAAGWDANVEANVEKEMPEENAEGEQSPQGDDEKDDGSESDGDEEDDFDFDGEVYWDRIVKECAKEDCTEEPYLGVRFCFDHLVDHLFGTSFGLDDEGELRESLRMLLSVEHTIVDELVKLFSFLRHNDVVYEGYRDTIVHQCEYGLKYNNRLLFDGGTFDRPVFESSVGVKTDKGKGRAVDVEDVDDGGSRAGSPRLLITIQLHLLHEIQDKHGRLEPSKIQ